jgi:hypothetical protein
MDFLCYKLVLHPRHLTMRLTIKYLSTILVIVTFIYAILDIAVLGDYLRLEFSVSLLLATICISGSSGILFLINMDKIINYNVGIERKLICVCLLC